ncbi:MULTISPECIES: DUF1266 domain-containing protein [Enterobacteriaceae]|uniref:DUF1266 domain-containing protein n=1 Tax=Enterobacteriaceae TaxID=543 RepID=UPI0015DC72BA|nr:DUF1266 domain-containing protein [Klebsiella sp. WP8-S18-ESBL-06]BBT72008.1 hypothetical protein WP8S18E06_33070 [Klebsiella sp. WP8-S18-ESBL-06]
MFNIVTPLAVFFACEIAERQFNLFPSKSIYHTVYGLVLVWLLLAIILHFMTTRRSEQTTPFAIAKLYNTRPVYPLRTDNERLAACAEALFLISETANPHPSISYINSLEQLDLNNVEDIKDARLLMSSAWNIDGDRALRKMLNKLITRATSGANIPMATIAGKERYIAFLQHQGLPFQDIDACPITGFDLVRASCLVRIGFSVGYIDEQEARSFLNIVGELIARQFTSWEQLTASYLVMYLEWNGGVKGPLGVLLSWFGPRNRILGARLLLEDDASPFRRASFQPYAS